MTRIALLAAVLGLSLAGSAVAGPLASGLPGPVTITPIPSAPQGVLAYRTAPELTRPQVFAIMGARLLVGEARPDPVGHGGSITLKDEAQPGFACTGLYRDSGRSAAWSQTFEGDARLDCTDGAQFQVAFHGMLGGGGEGCGTAYAQTVSLCYGFRARAAAHRLAPPPGFVLTVERGRLAMKPAGI